MANGQASPAAVTVGGTQAERIVLTRGELIKMLFNFIDFVKDKEAKEFPGWVDGVFAEARRDGAIAFDREAPVGRRFL